MAMPKVVCVAVLTLCLCGIAGGAGTQAASDLIETPLPATTWMGAGKAQLWLPPGVASLRGLVVIDGVGYGNRIFDSADWRKTALEQSWGMLFLKHGKQRGKEKQWAETGGAEITSALEELTKTLAADSKHPELANVPWAIWGHSGGGAIAYHAALHSPGRFFAALPYHGAVSHGKPGENEGPFFRIVQGAALQVPILFLVGEADIASITSDTKKQFIDDRSRHGIRAYLTQPRTDHLGLTATELQLSWLVAAHALRVPSDADFKKGPAKLRDVVEADGWLGDIETGDIAPFKDFKGDKAKAAWLPNESVAREWRKAAGKAK